MSSPFKKCESEGLFSFPLFSSSHADFILCLLLRDLRIQPLKPPGQTSGLLTQNEKAEILASLSSTVSVSLSPSVCLNIVARRGRGGSGHGDVRRRQTDAAWVKQTETKPAVRGSDSGGGEGGKTSKQHCVGDGNCGLAGHCLYQIWLEWYDVFRACSELFKVPNGQVFITSRPLQTR